METFNPQSRYDSLLRGLSSPRITPELKSRIFQAINFGEGGGTLDSWMKEITPKLVRESGKNEREVYGLLLDCLTNKEPKQ